MINRKIAETVCFYGRRNGVIPSCLSDKAIINLTEKDQYQQ